MSGLILPNQARVVRRLQATPVAVTVDDSPEPWFPANLSFPLAADTPATNPGDTSPRDNPPTMLQYAAGILGPQMNAPTRPGERVEVEGDLYELLGSPRNLRTGRRLVGHEIAVQTVETLYPYTASLQEGNGDVLAPFIPLALWAVAEEVRERSGWETLEAEAPVEFASELKPNRRLAIAGVQHHISRSFIPPDGSRARMSLRRKDTVA